MKFPLLIVLWFLAALVATILGYWGAWHWDMRFSGMDLQNLLWPQVAYNQRLFFQGQWPLWQDGTWGGAPQLAALQSMVLYPPLMALLLILPADNALAILILLHLAWLGLGTALLARRFNVSSLAAGVVALIPPISGFVFGHLEQANTIASLAWAPWLFLAILMAPGFSAVLAFSMTFAMAFLAGHPHYVVLSLTGAMTLMVLEWGRMGILFGRHGKAPSACRIIIRHGLSLALGGIFGLGLVAVQLLPTLELSALSERVWPYPQPDDPRLPWVALPALVVPRYLNFLADTSGRPLGLTEAGLYLGPLVVILAILSWTNFGSTRKDRWGTTKNPALLSLFLVTGGALIYSLGRQTPLFDFVNSLVPTLDSSRGAARANLVTTLGFSIMAGVTLSHVLRRFSPTRRWTLCAVAGVLIVAGGYVAHRPELKARIVPQEATVLQLTPPHTKLNSALGDGRLYRFMRDDSNFFLDDRPGAVQARLRRLQPNSALVQQIKSLDGYEEGLLPTYAYGNWLRYLNRNLRQTRPDPALLQAVGVTVMLTEYPLRDELGPPFKSRQTLEGELSWYQIDSPPPGPLSWLPASALPAWKAWSELLPRESLQSKTNPKGDKARPLRLDPSQEALPIPSLPLEETLSEAQPPHRFGLILGHTSPGIVVLRQNAYPGWRLRPEHARASGPSPLPKPERGAVVLTGWNLSENDLQETQRWVLEYRPFAFVLGQFISLLTGSVLALVSIRRINLRTVSIRSGLGMRREAYPTPRPWH